MKVYGDWMVFGCGHTPEVVEAVVLSEDVWGWMVFGCRHTPGG